MWINGIMRRCFDGLMDGLRNASLISTIYLNDYICIRHVERSGSGV